MFQQKLRNEVRQRVHTRIRRKLEVIEGIYKAVKLRRVVKLPAFDKKKRPSLRQEIRKQSHGKPETIDVTPPSGRD